MKNDTGIQFPVILSERSESKDLFFRFFDFIRYAHSAQNDTGMKSE